MVALPQEHARLAHAHNQDQGPENCATSALIVRVTVVLCTDGGTALSKCQQMGRGRGCGIHFE